jgi:hypothetical protein
MPQEHVVEAKEKLTSLSFKDVANDQTSAADHFSTDDLVVIDHGRCWLTLMAPLFFFLMLVDNCRILLSHAPKPTRIADVVTVQNETPRRKVCNERALFTWSQR